MGRVSLGTTGTFGDTFTAYSNQRKIVKTSTGKLVLFYADSNSGRGIGYKTSSDNGITWDASWTYIETYYRPDGNVDIIIDGADNIYVTWLYAASVTLYFVKLTYSGGTWSVGTLRTVRSGTGGFITPTLALLTSGRLIVTSVRVASGTSYLSADYSDNDGVSWTNSEYTISTGYENAHVCSSIKVGSTIWAITQYGASNLIYNIWNDVTTAWGSNNSISSSVTYYYGDIGVAKVSDSEIYAAAMTTSGIKIFKYTSSWDAGTLLSDNGGDKQPTLSIINSKPVAVWNDYTGTQYNIAYRKWNGTSWDAQVDFTNDAAVDFFPSAISEDVQTLYIVYQTGSSAPYTIYFDLAILAPITKTILSDAKIKIEGLQKSITSDARIAPITKTILSDASIKITDIQKIITSDARISPPYIDILSDAKIKVEDIQKTILSDSLIVIQSQKNILSDAKISVTGVQKSILSNAKIVIEVLYNIACKISFLKSIIYNINNKISIAQSVISDIYNSINIGKYILSDIVNDIRTQKLALNDAKHDIRFLKSWQKAVDGSIQSLGKEYITITIGAVLQTDIDVDSINISKGLSSSHTATFDLIRTYDSTKPSMDSTVEIKYSDWLLYFGYISNISPADSPEKMRITCQDEYWKQNQENVYYNVGHTPTDNKELYYPTVADALTNQHSWIPGVGNFVPETMSNFAVGKSDAITSLIQEAGNYEWFYDENKIKRLWVAGQGEQINLDRQTIGQNISLYNVISQNFEESIEEIVNKYRVQMGNATRRVDTNNSSIKGSSGSVTLTWKSDDFVETKAIPNWDSSLEILARMSYLGYGYDKHPPEENALYTDVFRSYYIELPLNVIEGENTQNSEISDVFEPYIIIKNKSNWDGLMNMSGEELTYITDNVHIKRIQSGKLYEGFTIDYKNQILYLSDAIYCYSLDSNKECRWIRSPSIVLHIGRRTTYTYTFDANSEINPENPEEDVSNPMMFFTEKMGTYSSTILKQLNLTQFSIQYGFNRSHYDYQTGITVNDSVPFWNDTSFATEYANWELSKKCDKKITGSVEITLDALCFYNIDLTKRIYISGITDSPMNITDISYNLNNFTVKLTLENRRYYNRTVSLAYHGE